MRASRSAHTLTGIGPRARSAASREHSPHGARRQRTALTQSTRPLVQATPWWSRQGVLIAAVALLAVPAAASFFQHGILSGFDLEYHSVTLAEFRRCMADGQWLARWCPNMGGGYGYPTFVYYPPLTYWLAVPFVLSGAAASTAMQVVMGLALVCGAIAMYLMASARWGRPAAVIAATAYTYAPYHLVTAYVKGAAAELVSFVWMPLIILALFRLETRPTTTRAIALAVAYAALILTNNSSALLFSLVVVAYVAWASARTRSIAFVAHAAAGLLAGVLLSAFFWLPAIVERSSVQISQMTAGYFDFDRHFVSLGELFYSPWNYGGSGFGNQFTRMAGVMQWGLVAAALVGLRRPQGRPERVFWLVVFAISTAMMLSVSAPVWAATPLLKFLQFPWKFLAATTFAGSCLCGALLAGATSERTRWAVASASVALILAIDLPHARPERVLAASAADVTTPAAVQAITIADMNHRDFTHYYTCYLPVQVCRVPHAVAGSKLETSADVHVLGEDLRTDRYAWHLTADRPVRVVVNTFWFPGWRATIDGRVVDITPETDEGRITLSVPSGEHDVTVRFGDTPLRWWSLVLSAAAALACAAAWIWRR